MQEFVDNNPYPSYDFIIKEIRSNPDRQLACNMENSYTFYAHQLLKRIYENISSSKIIYECGNVLNFNGGLTKMQMCYYVFANYAPFRFAKNKDIYYAYKNLEQVWDGIGEWEA